jgi:hypothetical protein
MRPAESVSMLLAHGADPQAGGTSACDIAALFEFDELAALLNAAANSGNQYRRS